MTIEQTSLLPWHEPQWRLWQQYVALESIPHALLLAGPGGLGKQQFAYLIAQSLLCATPEDGLPCGRCQACRLMPHHPDLHLIQPDQQFIRIAAIREMGRVINLTSRSWRVFIIQPADVLHPAAANALLKMLEEPTPNTLLILLSSAPQGLPATVRSRCQGLTFQAVATAQALVWLQQQQSQETAWESLLALSGHAPIAALAAQETGRLDRMQQLVVNLQTFSAEQAQLMPLVGLWSKQPFDQLLSDLTMICYDIARLSAGYRRGLFLPQLVTELQALCANIDSIKLLRFIGQLNQWKRQQQLNLNTTMCIEVLASSWLALRISSPAS
jgi:DNA polymerase-3 subunit delta'